MPPQSSLADILLFTPPTSSIPSFSCGGSSTLSTPSPVLNTQPVLSLLGSGQAPIIVNPNAPPVPGKLAQRIWNGEYIDMVELLPEARLDTDIDSDPKRKYKQKFQVNSILAWAECFMAYIGVIAIKDSSRVGDLLAYASTIIHAARQFQGDGWKVYDSNFRSQASALRNTSWAQINQSLFTTVFSNAQARSHCTTCLSLDHSTDDCMQKRKGSKQEEAGGDKPKTQGEASKPICKAWNQGRCISPYCSYRHVCLDCHEVHKITTCPLAKRYRPYPNVRAREANKSQPVKAPFRGWRDDTSR